MERIGFVGLGTMGAAMATNLRRAGFEVTVWNRTPGRADQLVELGAREAATPAAVAAASDVVVCCVSDTPDVEAVLFGDDGVARGVGPAASSSTAPRSRPAPPRRSRSASPIRASSSSMLPSPAARRARGTRR